MKILCVEDGSIDIDAIESDGLRNGKILVYRQGATPPFVLNLGDVDKDEELAIYKRALQLACEKYIDVDGISYVLIDDDEDYLGKSDEQIQKATIDYFLHQAKQELEEQDVKD